LLIAELSFDIAAPFQSAQPKNQFDVIPAKAGIQFALRQQAKNQNGFPLSRE